MSSFIHDNQAPVYTGNITIWPKWTEQDLLIEKWDSQTVGQAGKSTRDLKLKGASFEDPEGRTRLPHSLLRVLKEWKRPQELFGENLCVVRNVDRINLKEPNAHLMQSEFMRHFFSHVTMIWFLTKRKKIGLGKQTVTAPVEPVTVPELAVKTSIASHKESKQNIGKEATSSKTSQGGEPTPKALCFELDPMNDWTPWNLIYGGPPSTSKANVKAESPVGQVFTNLPHYNPNGKYAVKLFWMGSWRKVVVDDFIPVDENNQPLMPVCEQTNELWPLILTKAVLKVVSLDYGGSTGSSEIGDAGFILHVLTGYIPHVIYLSNPKSTRKVIWNKLQAILAINKKSPPEEGLNALAVKWDVRSRSALTAWNAQNDPAYIQKLSFIRASRLQSTGQNSTNTALSPQTALSNPVTLTPKIQIRSTSARSSSNVLRKVEVLSSPNALTPAHSALSEAPRTRNPKTPEVLIYASYHSAHHERSIFDQNAKSRSGNLYDNGFLRTESHPILLRNIRDVQPKVGVKSSVPRYKLLRPLRLNLDRYSQILVRHRKKQHPIRSLEFLSLFWTEKGRLTHQTSNQGSSLVNGEIPELADKIRWKPMDEYKPSLSAIPENCMHPRRRTRSFPLVIIPEVPSPLPTPPTEEKLIPSKEKSTESGKPFPNQPLPEPIPLSRIPSAPSSNKELQKHCRLNHGSLEFNRFYESLETIYIFTKPETFDYQSSFSFYQSNILTDGRSPPTKKKGGEQIIQQGVSGSETRSASTKSPGSLNPVKFGKIIADLPSPIMIMDNPYPTNVVLSVSTFSRWFLSLKTDAKSQERMSIVGGTMEELKDIEKPLPIIVSLKNHQWIDVKSDPTILTVKTSSVQGVCHQIPAGRHFFRLKVSCPGRRNLEPYGFFIRALSRDPIHIGTEENILKMAASDSYQYSILARKTILPILRWWHSNGSPNFSHLPHREIIAVLGLEEEANNKLTRRVFFDAMLTALYTAMRLYLREFCTVKGAFTLRVFIGDLVTRNILNLNKAQLAKKDSKDGFFASTSAAKSEIHATLRQAEGGKSKKQKGTEISLASPTFKVSAVGTAAIFGREIGKEQTPLIKKEKVTSIKAKIDGSQIKAVSFWQVYFQVAKASNILQARKSGSKKKETVLKTAQEMLDAILRNEQQFANCFLRSLCRNLPTDWLDLNFFYQQERRFIHREITGVFPDFPANTWKLFFRDTFNVQESLNIAFQLTTSISPMRLSIINNDTGEAIPSSFFHPLPFLFEKNESGYAVVAEANSGTLGWKNSSWFLRIVQALNPFKHESSQADSLLIKFNSGPTPLMNFVTKEICDFFLPDTGTNPTIARISLKIQSQILVTINFTSSNSDVLLELQILNNGHNIFKGVGRGIIVVPAFLFKISKSSQPESFLVVVTCLQNSWPLTGSEWKFAYTEKNRRIGAEYNRATPPTPPPSISPLKGEKSSLKKPVKGNSKERDKDDRFDTDSTESSRSKIKDKQPLFDFTKPHWTAKFLIDTTDTEFKCALDTSDDDAFQSELNQIVLSDLTIAQRGKDFREEFLRKNASFPTFSSPDLEDFPGWVHGTQKTNWPSPIGKFPLSFDLETFRRPPTGDEPEELDLFVHQKQMKKLSAKYNEALLTKNKRVVAERKNRDGQILHQIEMFKTLVDTTVSERRQYVEQRDAIKKKLDDRAAEEKKLLAPILVLDHQKTDDKHKGKKA